MPSLSTLFLSAEPYEYPGDYTSVTFAAVPVDAELCERLEVLATFCKRHKLGWVKVQHVGQPIFWDTPPGSPLEDCIVEYTEWHVDEHHANLTLWGRSKQPGGGHSAVLPLASSWVLDIEQLRVCFAQGFDLEYWEVEDWEERTGTAFAVAVHERVAELRAERLLHERTAE